MPDQTAINAVAAGRVLFLPETWNFMIHKIDRKLRSNVSPRVIHCTGPNKPWLYRDAPFGSVYLHHRNATPFPVAHPHRRYRSIVRRLFNLVLGRRKYWRQIALGLRSRQLSTRYLKQLSARPQITPGIAAHERGVGTASERCATNA